MKIALIIGHTERHRGAYSPSLRFHEYDLWCDVGIDVWREAREYGFDAKMFKRDGITIERVGGLVNEWADVAIELHFNSAMKVIKNPAYTPTNGQPETMTITDIDPNGCETLYDAHPPESKHFAGLVHKAILTSLTEPNPQYNEANNPFVKPKDRGLKLIQEDDRGHRNLSSVHVPSCLIEPFFGSNARDCQRFKRNRAQFCRALVLACSQFKLEAQ